MVTYRVYEQKLMVATGMMFELMIPITTLVAFFDDTDEKYACYRVFWLGFSFIIMTSHSCKNNPDSIFHLCGSLSRHGRGGRDHTTASGG